VVQTRPTDERARRDSIEGEVLDGVLIEAVEYPTPEIEDGPATLERSTFVEWGWRTVFDVGGEQSKYNLQVPTIEGIAGAVES
jgi:hypothetical protein